MNKRIVQKAFLLVLVLTLVLSACQMAAAPDPALIEGTLQAAVQSTLTAAPTSTPLPSATATATLTVTPTPVIVRYGPGDFPENVNPLTGLEVDDPSILDRRPVMVKVANQASARPHAGLSNADIVFDYYIGSGLDRYLALYYSKDDTHVGTVRSGRYVDVPLVQMYNGILGMMSAYKPELDEILVSLGGRVINTEHCDERSTAICNDGPKTEISAFANTAEMSELYSSRNAADNVRQNLDGMAFGTLPPEGGETALQVTMHWGKNVNQEWRYDEATHKYLRWIDQVDSAGYDTMIPLVDRNTGEQISASNVIFVFADLTTLNGATDSIHRYAFDGRDGRALICRDGKIYDVFYDYTWNMPLSFHDAEGNPFELQPGNTWIHLANTYSQVREDPADIWTVNLYPLP